TVAALHRRRTRDHARPVHRNRRKRAGGMVVGRAYRFPSPATGRAGLRMRTVRCWRSCRGEPKIVPLADQFQLRGRTALVTGASAGIGAAIAVPWLMPRG